MKILVITRDHITDFTGGTRVYAHDVERFLAQRGHDIVHLCYNSPKTETIELDKIKVVKLKKSKIIKPFFFIYRLIKIRTVIARLYAEYNPDYIFYHGAETAQFLFLSGIPYEKLVYYVHAMNSHEILYDAVKNLRKTSFFKKIKTVFRAIFYFTNMYVLEEIALRICSKIITDSEYDKSEIIAWHGNGYNPKTDVVHIGIDLDKYHPAENKLKIMKELQIPESKNVMVVFRRLAPRMGLENLIDGFSKIKNLNDCILYIGGKGELKEVLENRIRELNLNDKVILLGYVSDEDKIRYLQASDFFILPTEELEGFGIVTLEAYACNLAVIGTPVGAIPEIISPLDPDMLTKDNSSESLTEKIDWAINNKNKLLSSDKYRKYVEKNYNWEDSISKIERILK